MIDKLNLELLREIDCKELKKVKILASSYDKTYQIVFNGVINFNYSIDDEKDLIANELDIIEIDYQFGCLKKEMLKYYSYKANKGLFDDKYHYLFIYGDLELIILSKELTVNELKGE